MNSVSQKMIEILTMNTPIIAIADLKHCLVRLGFDHKAIGQALRLLVRHGVVVTATVNTPVLNCRTLMVDRADEISAKAIAAISKAQSKMVAQPTKIVFASPQLLALSGKEPIRMPNYELRYRYLRLGKAFSQFAQLRQLANWQTAWPKRKLDTVIARVVRSRSTSGNYVACHNVACYVVAIPAMTVAEAQDWLGAFIEKEERYVVC